jgi:hypothetical protein
MRSALITSNNIAGNQPRRWRATCSFSSVSRTAATHPCGRRSNFPPRFGLHRRGCSQFRPVPKQRRVLIRDGPYWTPPPTQPNIRLSDPLLDCLRTRIPKGCASVRRANQQANRKARSQHAQAGLAALISSAAKTIGPFTIRQMHHRIAPIAAEPNHQTRRDRNY